MASKKKGFKKKTIKEEYGESGGFGKYKEDNGGGTPVGGGFGGPSGRVGWQKRKDEGQSGHRESQPRTKDGKFTYASVNGKELAPSSDPTRGKTVNPLLTGGENGVMIEDVEKEFSQESGSYWDKYKDKWYRKGAEIVTRDMKVRIAGESLWNIAKGKFDKVKGEFKKEEGSFDEVKKGRSSVEEKTAKQKVQSSKDEAAVIDNKGGIKLKPGVTPASIVTPAPAKPYRPKGSTVTPTAPVGGGQPQQPVSGATINTQGSTGGISKSKYPDDEREAAIKTLNQMGISLDGLSVEEIDAIIDEYFE